MSIRSGRFGGGGGVIGMAAGATLMVLVVMVMSAGFVVATSRAAPAAAPSLADVAAKGQRRIGAVTASGFAVSASGRFTEAQFQALGRPIVNLMGPDDRNERYRSFEGGATSTGAAASTYNVRLYRVKKGTPPFSTGVVDYELSLVGTLGATVSSATGVGNGAIVDAAEKIVSGWTYTPALAGSTPPGIADYLKSAYGGQGVVVYSPGGTTPGLFNVSDCGNGEWLLFDVGDTAGATVAIYGEAGT